MSGYRPDNGFEGLMAHVREELNEDVTPKLKPAPQNMNTVEEPKLDPEEIGVEDYSEEDLNSTPAKPAPKSKSKEDDRYKIREVPDKEVENPVPKKEAKTGKGDLYLCENCYKTFRSHEAICPHCRSNIVERVVQEEDYSVGDLGSEFKPTRRSRHPEAGKLPSDSAAQDQKYTCPKCKGRFRGYDLAKGRTCPDCDVPVKVMRESKDNMPPFAVTEKGWFYRAGDELKADSKLQRLLRRYGPDSDQVFSYVAQHQGTTTPRDTISDLIKYVIGTLETSESRVTEGEDRTEEIANAIAHALQPMEYWHSETVPSAAGTHFEFITTGGPKVKVYIEKSDPEMPEEN